MIHCANFSHGARMENVSIRLRDLRKSAVPRLTVRAMAAELDLPLGTYSFYESPTKFKKAALPLDLARKIASVLAKHGVDPSEAMKLAGLSEAEAEPEARAVESARPVVQYVSLQVALPSEAALRDMFRSLLVLVPDGSTKDETAEILARWLPSGFAGIGPYLPDPGAGASPAGDTPPPTDATDHHESGPSSRT